MQEKFSGPLISQADGGDFFEVWRDDHADGSFVFVGFFNGERSVEGTDPNTCYRGLWKKHRTDARQPEVIDFTSEKDRRRP